MIKRNRTGYWKTYYSKPKNKAKHLAAVHATTVRRRAVTREWLNTYKLERGCKVCGFNEHACVLDFAHKDRQEKSINLANTIRAGWSLDRIKTEVEKCDVLCANHHRIATMEETERDTTSL